VENSESNTSLCNVKKQLAITKAKYNAGFRAIRSFVQRSRFSGTAIIPSSANPHYT
jgi:hypothetical protein